MKTGLFSLAILSSVRPCLGAIYDSIAGLPRNQSFDFIIVGGGTAGNVVANRLSENPNFSVLVLEAGSSPEGLLNYTVPFFGQFTHVVPNPRDWNYTTIPLPGLNGRAPPFPRGRLLGGCSSMNGMQYDRGSKEDYDRYARISGDPGWGVNLLFSTHSFCLDNSLIRWDALQPYIRRNEHWTPPVDNHNQTGQFNPTVHGFHGINAVSLSGFLFPIDGMIQQVTQELSDEFPFNLDYNSGSPLGVSWSQATIKHGKRSSSFTSYLGPEFIGRPNLHVVLNTQVTRIIQTSQSPVTFKMVEFAESRKGATHLITATKEVIISAGSIETPKLLMNAGIGDPTVLSSLGIKPRVNLPDVGKNLSVHTGVSLGYFVNSTDTFDDIFRNLTVRKILLDQWLATDGGGRLSASLSGHTVFKRLPSNSSVLAVHADPAAGPNSPHIQSGAENGLLNPLPEGHFISVGATLVTPTSRRSIELNTTDPFDNPLIKLGCLSTNFDIAAIREGMKSALRFIGAKAWDGYVLGPVNNITTATSDADLEAYARAHAAPNGHVVGTATMSPRGANYGVVDPDLIVKGVRHLRVIDASVWPYVPAGNTQASVYILAERAADLIKVAWE
ncbi:Aryl-alcohol-oxidase from pleurotus Eryingii [Mycena venus]|uniref:Aryl-alcohol-oxidase from pleurotus Eryingii n=1 Tax=Mycena venus TaxID=2733690 RepID=A0A8H6YA72_9AGAR|nr:Aryl-alcohol-oxidase from pleurotus Eryingii [Mycena venus]